MSNYYVNEDIKNCFRIFSEEGRSAYLRMDMNENPEGLPGDFVDSVLAEITPEYLATYPEPGHFCRKYAKQLGIRPEQVCATSGSDTAIRYIMETFVGRGHKVVTVTPTFEMYRVYCNMYGYEHVGVPYDSKFQISVEDILNTIDERTDLVALLNPNNPIGRAFTEDEVRTIMDKVTACGAVMVIDEAYHYFYPNTFIKLIDEYDNLLLLRTFSKMYSIAGCRLGAVIGCEQLIEYINHVRSSAEVNTVALLFGERLIDHPEVLDELIRTEREGRKYLIDELEKHGYTCHNQDGNFLFIEPKSDSAQLAQRLKDDYKVLIKRYGNPLLSKYIRISTGSKAAMSRFLEAFLAADRA
ncbi:MAG: histidinol-phosphate aminotransferase family protein [Lachnospiraceae bacterium]|nr:histidinol-phosphate aminotransferase family protein [Lachnospiraceae bacterium]